MQLDNLYLSKSLRIKITSNLTDFPTISATVVVAFFLCWAPFHLQRLLYVYARDWEHYPIMNEWVFFITGCFYYLSSTVNPILYNVMSAKYREAFKDTLCCWRRPSSRASFRDNYTDSSMLYRGRCVQNTLLRKCHIIFLFPWFENCTEKLKT